MSVQTHVSVPSISLISTEPRVNAVEQLKVEIDKKNKNKEMFIDMLMLALLFVAPILLTLLI